MVTTLDARALRLLWRLLWLAPPLYAGAGVVLRARMAHPPPAASRGVVLAAVLAVAMHTVAWVAVDARFESAVVRSLSRWLLAELTAFVAMVLFVVGGAPWLVLSMFAWALVLHVLAAPRPQDAT